MPLPEPQGRAQAPSVLPSDLQRKRSLLLGIARTVRRMRSNEDFDAEGLRTIWHRGQQRVELLSWENRDGVIVRQELAFLGMVVEIQLNKGLRTGLIPLGDEATHSHKPQAQMLQMDAEPSPSTLDCASHLLKHIEDRDFYVQHLLREVNDAVAAGSGFDSSKTAVSSLQGFFKDGRSLKRFRRRMTLQSGGILARSNRKWIWLAACMGATAGALAVLLLT